MTLSAWTAATAAALLVGLSNRVAVAVHEGDVTNHLAVFTRYQEVTTFNTGDFYTQATVCEGHGGLQWTKLTWCVESLTVNTMKRNESNANHHWKRPVQPSPKASISSCNYALQNFRQAVRGDLYFTFDIVQSNCTAEWYKGGSAFDVVAAGDALKACSVRDNFDNTYLVTCNMRGYAHVAGGEGRRRRLRHRHRRRRLRSVDGDAGRALLPAPATATEPASAVSEPDDSDPQQRALALAGVAFSCVNVTVRLDFEHYDAFSERGAYYERQFSPWQIVIAQDVPFCPEAAATAPAAAAAAATAAATAGAVVLGGRGGNATQPLATVHGDGIEAAGLGMWVLNDSARSLPATAVAAPARHVWRWQHPSPEIDVAACLTRQRVVMMGASHCRYNWDALALAAFPAEVKPVFLKTARHHMAMKFNKFEFNFIFFAREYAPALRKVCDEVLETKQNTTLLLQPGSWDSTFWPAQQFIFNPASAPSALEELRAMVTTRGCGQYLSFVWVQQVPYPNCLMHVPDGNAANATDHCADERRARNNQKIGLMNAYLERELRKLHREAGGKMRLQIVPAYDIIAPRLQYAEYVCNNHFLCRNDNTDTMTGQTPAGLAVYETVKRAICRNNL